MQTRLIVEQRLFSRYDLQPPLRFVYIARRLGVSQHDDGAATCRRRESLAPRGTVRCCAIVTQYPGIDPSTGKPFTTEVTTRVSLRSPTELLVESTRAGVLGGQPTTGRTVYRKNP